MKNNIKIGITCFILGAIIFGGVGVLASQIFARDITYNNTNVESALNDLYSKVDNYDNKVYTQEGLIIYDNRVTILEGGYYVDNNNTTWVNLKLKTNIECPANDACLLIYNFPNMNHSFFVTDINRQYVFNEKLSSYPNDFCYANSATSLPKNTIFSVQFKY